MLAFSFAQAKDVQIKQDELPAHMSSYDSQIKEIFKSVVTGSGAYTYELENASHTDAQKTEKLEVLKKIYDKLVENKMLIKNVVFRKDVETIRVSFADSNNDYIFKVTYKTDYDPVITNSIYADKQKIVDVKIMYRKNNDYEYINLLNKDNDNKSNPLMKEKNSSQTVDRYIIQTSLSDQRCGFCHVLAKNDSHNNSGIFFPRYHEATKKIADLEKGASVFRESDFVLKTKDQVSIALPKDFPNQFYYSSISNKVGLPIDDMTKYSRLIIETPELVEILAKDNRANYCINIYHNNNAFDNNNYVCADYDNKKLYIRHNNPFQSSKGLVEMFKDFF